MMTLSEFRRYRDESALASYAERWPLLDAERERIWAAIQQAKARIARLEKRHERVPANVTEDYLALWRQYTDVDNEMALIIEDKPRREAALASQENEL